MAAFVVLIVAVRAVGSPVVWNVPGDFDTIQAAIEAAANGDKILVGPGEYNESLYYDWKRVSVQSTHGPEVTVIRPPAGQRGASLGGEGAEIIGFTITGGGASEYAAIRAESKCLVKGNIIEGYNTSYSVIGAFIASPVIEQNVIRNNTVRSSYGNGIIRFANDSHPVITNNLFAGNSGANMFMHLPQGAYPTVTNNTIVGGWIGMLVSQGICRNNIVVGANVGIYTRPDVIENNLVWDNTINYQDFEDQTGLNGNISADPMFVDPAGDYRLQWGSPAIDAGTSVGAPAVDLLNHPRPFDGDFDGTPAFDMGAYEYVPEPSTLVLLGMGGLGLLVCAWRRRRRRA